MIELKNVTKKYGDFVAVNDVSFTVANGEVCVLIGPSGCGKSTTIKLINRMLEPTSGDIYVEGKHVNNERPDFLRRKIGYVIQNIGLFPHMTVAENIAVVPKLLGWERPRIEERTNGLLDLIGLSARQYAMKFPRQLSGGEAQRIGVARALAADPPLLLMDEPFGAVDPLNRQVLQAEFLKIQRQLHKTVIFVTHDLDEALKIGTRIAIMKDGRVIQVGPPEDIVLRPADDYVADFVKHMNPLTALRAVSLMTPVDALPQQDGLREFQDSDTYTLALHADGRLDRFACLTRASAGQGGTAELLAEPAPMTASPRATLKDVLEMRQQSKRPVLICEEDRVVGVCGSNEILDALTNAGRAAIAETA